MGQALQRLHIPREANHQAMTLAPLYSRALTHWGVQLQRAGQLQPALDYFSRALELNRDNPVALINRQLCNENLQDGRRSAVKVGKHIEDQFGRYRDWEAVMNVNGPFDEPTFVREQGNVFFRGNNHRQAAQQYQRAVELSPEDLTARFALAHLHLINNHPTRALEVVSKIRADGAILGLSETNLPMMLKMEASAYLSAGNSEAADRVVNSALDQDPKNVSLLAVVSEIYINFGQFTNAVKLLDRRIQLDPDNPVLKIDKGFCLIQMQDFEAALAPLSQALSITNHPIARLNRGIALLKTERFKEAKADYEAIQKEFPTAYVVNFGLGEIAYNLKDVNTAIRHYQLYQAQAPTNTAEAQLVASRLKELKKGYR